MSNIPLQKARIIFTLATVIALLFLVACGAAEESPAAPEASPPQADGSAAPAQTQPEPAAPAASDAPAQAPAASSSGSGQAAAPAPTAAPAASGAAPASAPQSDVPTGTLRIALDEIGPSQVDSQAAGRAPEQHQQHHFLGIPVEEPEE